MGNRKRRDYLKNPIDLSYKEIDISDFDDWQKEVYDYWGNLALQAGRQVGKSYCIAKKTAKALTKWKGLKILVLAASERQAGYLYEKIKQSLKWDCGDDVFAGIPTMKRTTIKNGSAVYCMPTGKNGDLIRGEDFDIIIFDEGAYIPNLVYVAVLPMLDVARSKGKFGWIWTLSTPFGDEGFFYDFCHSNDFRHWHINGEFCPRKTKEDLERYKRLYTKQQYMQEIQGEFVNSIQKVFSTELIKSVIRKLVLVSGKRFLGMDAAGLGQDNNAYVGVNQSSSGGQIQTYFEDLDDEKNTYLTSLKIDRLIQEHKFRKCGIDGLGVGQGIFDVLKTIKYPTRVINLQNSKKNDNTGRVLKIDMYSKAIILMERTQKGEDNGIVIDEKLEDLILSLDSVKFEQLEGKTKIYGIKTHLAEAFVRAIWFTKTKALNFWVHGF